MSPVVSQKLSKELPYESAMAPPRYALKRTENKYSSRSLLTNVHDSTIHNSQKTKTPECPPVNEQVNKLVAYSHNGILFSNTNESSTDSCRKLDKPRTHSVKGNRPDTEGHILYDSFYVKRLQWVNPQRRKPD